MSTQDEQQEQHNGGRGFQRHRHDFARVFAVALALGKDKELPSLLYRDRGTPVSCSRNYRSKLRLTDPAMTIFDLTDTLTVTAAALPAEVMIYHLQLNRTKNIRAFHAPGIGPCDARCTWCPCLPPSIS